MDWIDNAVTWRHLFYMYCILGGLHALTTVIGWMWKAAMYVEGDE